MHSFLVSAAFITLAATNVLAAPAPQAIPPQATISPKPDDPCKGTNDPTCYYWPQNQQYYLTAYATAAATPTTKPTTTTTTPAARSPTPNSYLTITACSQPQTTGSASAWKGTECKTFPMLYSTVAPQTEQQIQTPNSLGYYSTGQCMPLTYGGATYNAAINSGSWPLNCVLAVVADCQEYLGQSSSLYGFTGSVYDTSKITGFYISPPTSHWGTYLKCLVPGQVLQ